MDYSIDGVAYFLHALSALNQNYNAIADGYIKGKEQFEEKEKSDLFCIRGENATVLAQLTKDTAAHEKTYLNRLDESFLSSIRDKKNLYKRLYQCKKSLCIVQGAEQGLAFAEQYQSLCGSMNIASANNDLSLDDILSDKFNFINAAIDLDRVLKEGKKKDALAACKSFYSACRTAEVLLEEECQRLKKDIVHEKSSQESTLRNISTEYNQDFEKEWSNIEAFLDKALRQYVEKSSSIQENTKNEQRELSQQYKQALKQLGSTFSDKFRPSDVIGDYVDLCKDEPLFDDYACASTLPRQIRLGSYIYKYSASDLSQSTKDFLTKNYPSLYQNDSLIFPQRIAFDSDLNLLFRYKEDQRDKVVSNARDICMRLFMMLPPGKLNVTFVDPVGMGASFAMFTRLVDIDDRTSEVINGKIWADVNDIQEKLHILTEHISNVTQRCLQGKYANIYEYNKVAEQNAEPYQVLMLMDFPAGFNDQSLKYLEQIVNSGPKCGVFTIIYQNENQYSKVSPKTQPIVDNIELHFDRYKYTPNSIEIDNAQHSNSSVHWAPVDMPSTNQLEKIIATLKQGIKTADRVVIGIDKISQAETSNSTKDGIRIPIGIHGANEVQYMTLGVGGSHHALIAGVAGSGKSSLIHTILLRALQQYTPEELAVYLVDFKRGVEFKIYADYVLPAFRVVAIESEREFGYSILQSLEHEQKVRASLFKKERVDRIEDYRALGKKMPRILVIMDEFHELFAGGNDDLARSAAVLMERIVRQGRAFGVHLILASQSYSNIGGLSKAVYDQMAVRIVLKCSKTDANLLLDDGSNEIDQISIDDPGRAVYNSEAGNKEYNSHFRVAYIDPSEHRKLLAEISAKTASYQKIPTKILLSNIEDNKYCIFNQFEHYTAETCPVLGRLYIGESLNVSNELNISLSLQDYANLIMVGNDTDKARSMFAFSVLSICINYYIKNRHLPSSPFIHLINYKPLEDVYFSDTLKLIAEHLSAYVDYIPCNDTNRIQTLLDSLYTTCTTQSSANGIQSSDQFFFVFGYQRAEDLKSEINHAQQPSTFDAFSLMPNPNIQKNVSPKEMFHIIVERGSAFGIHTILWNDSFTNLYQNDGNMISYFSQRIAFDMEADEFSRFVSENNFKEISANNAIYYNRAKDNQKFRPYQTPDDDFVEMVCRKLNS